MFSFWPRLAAAAAKMKWERGLSRKRAVQVEWIEMAGFETKEED